MSRNDRSFSRLSRNLEEAGELLKKSRRGVPGCGTALYNLVELEGLKPADIFATRAEIDELFKADKRREYLGAVAEAESGRPEKLMLWRQFCPDLLALIAC
jgi:hypothetical protein